MREGMEEKRERKRERKGIKNDKRIMNEAKGTRRGGGGGGGGENQKEYKNGTKKK